MSSSKATISRKTNLPRRSRGSATDEIHKERAFLVGLDYRTRSRVVSGTKSTKGSLTNGAQAARESAAASSPVSKAPNIPEFSAEESLDELRALAGSAGAEIAGEFLQRRERPDPATLIGRGKLEEIAGAAA